MFKLSTNQVAFLLMENGASVDIVDSAGRSALFHAVISGEEAAIEAVIRRGGRLGLGNIGDGAKKIWKVNGKRMINTSR